MHPADISVCMKTDPGVLQIHQGIDRPQVGGDFAGTRSDSKDGGFYLSWYKVWCIKVVPFQLYFAHTGRGAPRWLLPEIVRIIPSANVSGTSLCRAAR